MMQIPGQAFGFLPVPLPSLAGILSGARALIAKLARPALSFRKPLGSGVARAANASGGTGRGRGVRPKGHLALST